MHVERLLSFMKLSSFTKRNECILGVMRFLYSEIPPKICGSCLVSRNSSHSSSLCQLWPNLTDCNRTLHATEHKLRRRAKWQVVRSAVVRHIELLLPNGIGIHISQECAWNPYGNAIAVPCQERIYMETSKT